MPVSLSTIAAKDGAAATLVGGLLAMDKSGAGTGPWSLAHVLVDGVAGTLLAQITAANALKVDGSAVVQPVKIDQTTDLTTNKVRAFIHDGTTALPILAASSGAPAASSPAIPVSLRDMLPPGRALPTASAPVVLNSMTYKAVAASATATLFGATGASGDYLDGVLIIPATIAAGAVSITDGSGSPITIFVGGGTTALPACMPFFVPIGAISSGGAGGWKVTTGTNVSVIGVGNFT